MLNLKQPFLIAAAVGVVALAGTATVFVLKGPAPKAVEPVSVGRLSGFKKSGMDLGLGDRPVAERHQYTLTPPDTDSTDMVRRSQWGPSESDEISSTAQAAGANIRTGQEGDGGVPEAPADAIDEIPPAPEPVGSGFKLQDQDVAGKTGATSGASGASSSFSTPVPAQPEGALERLVAAAGQVLSKGKNIARALGGGSRQATRSGQSGTLKKQGLATAAGGGGGDTATGGKSRAKGFGLDDEGGGANGGGDEGLIDCAPGTRPMMTGTGSNPWKCESMKDKNDELAKKLKDEDGSDSGGDLGEDNDTCVVKVGSGFYKATKPKGTPCPKSIDEPIDQPIPEPDQTTPAPEETPVPEETATKEETPVPEETPIGTNNVNVNVMTKSWSEAAQVVKEGAVSCQSDTGKKIACVGKDHQPLETSTEVSITAVRESAKALFEKGTLRDCTNAGGKFQCIDNSSGKPQDVHWSEWGAYVDWVDKKLAAANEKYSSCRSDSECRQAKAEQANAQAKMDVLLKTNSTTGTQSSSDRGQTTSSGDKKNQGNTGSQNNQAVSLLDKMGNEAMNVKTDVCDSSQGFYKIGSHCQQVGTTSMAAFPDKKSPTGYIFMTPAQCGMDRKYEFRVTNFPGPGHGECVLKKTTTANNSTSTGQTTTKTNTTNTTTSNTSAKNDFKLGSSGNFNSGNFNSLMEKSNQTNKTQTTTTNTQKTPSSTNSGSGLLSSAEAKKETASGKKCSFAQVGGQGGFKCK